MSAKGNTPFMNYSDKTNLLGHLRAVEDESLGFVVVSSGAFKPEEIEHLQACLLESVRVLRKNGLLFVQGTPDRLPSIGVWLERYLTFKYWIAIKSAIKRTSGLPTAHAGMLLFAKPPGFNVEKVRLPHKQCTFCGRTLKDWGGKTHLMHPDGYTISDVWRDLPPENNYTRISEAALEIILRMVAGQRGIIGPIDAGESNGWPRYITPPLPGMDVKPIETPATVTKLPEERVNVVHQGDAVETLRSYPDGCVDLAFADPPYNLQKAYTVYRDGFEEKQYIRWCNTWLQEYARVLKPTGSLYVLNLPRWAMHHAHFLNTRLYFQNWIVWDALPEPRGKIMPAHYGLLFYTKHPTQFTLNYENLAWIDSSDYCLRISCIRRRKAQGEDKKVALTDIWWDVSRIRHARDRDYHPCQLPEKLMERIVRLSSNEGDIVLDALCGTGTTLIAAAKLGRRYIGIDMDSGYVELSRRKLEELEREGRVIRPTTTRVRRNLTKKELQLELRRMAVRLGRLPTPKDVQAEGKYDVETFYQLFPTWGKALRAAKLITHEQGK